MTEYAVRLARADELEVLARIEDDAGRLYAQVGLPADLPGLPLSTLVTAQATGLLWVMALHAVPVGFALCIVQPNALHLRELDVLPEHGRRGLGQRLLDHVANEARARNLAHVSLTTFADIPWNAPYYERHGFTRLADAALPEWLKQIREHEAELGLDRWPRTAMWRTSGWGPKPFAE